MKTSSNKYLVWFACTLWSRKFLQSFSQTTFQTALTNMIWLASYQIAVNKYYTFLLLENYRTLTLMFCVCYFPIIIFRIVTIKLSGGDSLIPFLWVWMTAAWLEDWHVIIKPLKTWPGDYSTSLVSVNASSQLFYWESRSGCGLTTTIHLGPAFVYTGSPGSVNEWIPKKSPLLSSGWWGGSRQVWGGMQ